MEWGAAASVKRAGGLVMERDAKNVVPISREVVCDSESASSAVRCAFNLFTLGDPSRDLETCFSGRRVWVADG